MKERTAYELRILRNKMLFYTVGFIASSIFCFIIIGFLFIINGYRVLLENQAMIIFLSIAIMFGLIGIVFSILYLRFRRLLNIELYKNKEGILSRIEARNKKLREYIEKKKASLNENQKIVDYGDILGEEYSNEKLGIKATNEEEKSQKKKKKFKNIVNDVKEIEESSETSVSSVENKDDKDIVSEEKITETVDETSTEVTVDKENNIISTTTTTYKKETKKLN